jgi:hypothetical protein
MRTINISGPDGNAFALMGYAQTFAKQLGIDSKPIIEDMMSGDYDNLLDIFKNNFRDVVELVEDDNDE